MSYIIREIHPNDNAEIAAVIRNVFIELDAPKVGTAFADPHLDTLFEVYNNNEEIYFVVESQRDLFFEETNSIADFSENNPMFVKKIVGGCGIGKLVDAEFKICELQKMYLSTEARGQGIAQQLMRKCLEFAANAGYDKCYIETLPFMKTAQQLYKNFGFSYIDGPLGDTGHSTCEVFMIKDL